MADRFHLVHNVGEALKKLLRSHRWIVPEPETAEVRHEEEETHNEDDSLMEPWEDFLKRERPNV